MSLKCREVIGHHVFGQPVAYKARSHLGFIYYVGQQDRRSARAWFSDEKHVGSYIIQYSQSFFLLVFCSSPGSSFFISSMPVKLLILLQARSVKAGPVGLVASDCSMLSERTSDLSSAIGPFSSASVPDSESLISFFSSPSLLGLASTTHSVPKCFLLHLSTTNPLSSTIFPISLLYQHPCLFACRDAVESIYRFIHPQWLLPCSNNNILPLCGCASSPNCLSSCTGSGVEQRPIDCMM